MIILITINKPNQIPYLTKENVRDIVFNYETKYKLGFTINEVRELLRPNNLKEWDFFEFMFGSTYSVINEDNIYYHRDVYNTIWSLIK